MRKGKQISMEKGQDSLDKVLEQYLPETEEEDGR
jgi:hypothetical protein